MTALLKITQGSDTDIAGRALLGSLTGGAVIFANGDNTGVATWKYEVLNVPPTSAIPLTTQGPNTTPTFTMAQPDAPGSYRIRLTVTHGDATTDVDIRNLVVPFTNGLLCPPYQGNPVPLTPGTKPDELNIGGQAFGWQGDSNTARPLMWQIIKELDGLITAIGIQGPQGAQGVQGIAGLDFPSMGAIQPAGYGTRKVLKAEGPTLPTGAGGYTLLDIDGAGFLSQISMTFNGTDADTRSKSRLQIFVDGESVPSVDVRFLDLCCARGSGGNFNSASIVTTRFSSFPTAFGIGTSFRADIVAPFSTHIKVVIINGGAATALLGGFLEYYLGTYNWGRYGKLCCVSLPDAGLSVAPYADVDLLTLTGITGNGGVFVGSYLHWQGGDGNYQYQEGDFQVYVNGSFVMQYDSTEDYYSAGFYFAGGTFLSEDIGATYRDGTATVGAYRFHYRDPFEFATGFKFQWTNGFNGALPTLTNTVVRGVLWYYLAATGSVDSPTILKGDQGNAGADGRNQLSAVDHTAVADTVSLWQGNGTLDDTFTLNYTLSAGTARYQQLIPGCPTRGFYFDGATYLLRDLRSSFLDLAADMTVQFLLAIFATDATAGATIISYSAPGEMGGDDNALWQISIGPAATGTLPVLGWFSEHGAGVNDSITSTYMLPLFQMLHISIKRSGTNLIFYINGQPADTFTGITLPTLSGSPTQKLRLGADPGGTPQANTKFLLASLRIANTARSDAAILADAQSCLGWV